MRLTIIPHTGTVNVDGVSYSGFDLSFMDSTIHAVQWKNTFGGIERWNPETEQMVANEPITNISQFQQAIDLWNEKNAQVEVYKAELERQLAALNSGS
jgi:hypothetical protein